MKQLSILFVLLVSGSVNAQLPPVMEVVKQYFKEYSIDRPVTHHLGFEKRQDGYHVVRKKEGVEIEYRQLFYDAASQKYLPLNREYFTDRSKANSGFPQPTKHHDGSMEFQADYYIRQFELYPYYGYNGWYKDVVQYCEAKDSLSLDELNALGRSYSFWTSALFSNQSGLADPTDQFKLNENGEINDEQLIAFNEVLNKCLATYQKIIDIDPEYETPVGDVVTKYANEVVFGYLLLLQYKGEEAAKKVLKPGLYGAYVLESATNLLNSCPENAILLTYGDTDTYPLYYLQATKGIRTDVTIANSSLLYTPLYNKVIRRGLNGSEPIPTLLPDAFFDKTVVVYWNLMGNGSTLTFRELNSLLGKKEDLKEFRGSYIVKKDHSDVSLAIPPNMQVEGQALFHWKPAKGPYTSLDLSILDFLAANKWERPVCFPLTSHYSTLKTWKNYLKLDGLVYTIQPYPTDVEFKYLTQSAVDIESSEEFWDHEFIHESREPVHSYDDGPFYQTTRQAFYMYTKAILDGGDTIQAGYYATRMLEWFPDEKKAFDGSTLYFAQILSIAGKEEELEYVLRTVYENYESGRNTDFARDYAYNEILRMARLHQFKNLIHLLE